MRKDIAGNTRHIVRLIGNSKAVHGIQEQNETNASAGKTHQAADPFTLLLIGNSSSRKECTSPLLSEKSGNLVEFVRVNCAGYVKDLLNAKPVCIEQIENNGSSNERHCLFNSSISDRLFLDDIGQLTIDDQLILLRLFEHCMFHCEHCAKKCDKSLILCSLSPALNHLLQNNGNIQSFHASMNPCANPLIESEGSGPCHLFIRDEPDVLKSCPELFCSEVKNLLINSHWLGKVCDLKRVIYRNISFSDQELMQSIAIGDNDAWALLYERHYQHVYRFILGKVKDESLAKDITQETFIRVSIKARAYIPMAKPLFWIRAIARNLCIDYFREKKNTEHLEKSLQNPFVPEWKTGDFDDVCNFCNKELLDKALNQLPVKLRNILVLLYLEGLSYVEIAEIYGFRKQTVKNLASKAREEVRKIFKKWELF